MMNTRFATRFLLVLVVLSAACLGGRGRNRGGSGPVVISVRNNNWADVVVYAVSGSQTLRIGDVTTGRTTRFNAPSGVDPTTRDFRIRIDPIGPRGSFLTPLINVGPGQTVFLVVENDLGMTNFTVR
jgi:hypothetical protein